MHLDSLHASEITRFFIAFEKISAVDQGRNFETIFMILNVPVLLANEWLNSGRPVLPKLMAPPTK